MEFTVSLEQFEGPLDLMLHLIHQNKLDLFDLNLDILASQYVAYIRKAMEESLEVSSEYLVEFTSLMEYKSKKLLPRPQQELPDQYEENMQEKLAARLQEYARCKEEAKMLEKLYEARSRLLEREASGLIEEWRKPVESDELPHLPVSDLVKAMQTVMRRYALMQPYQSKIEVRELSVEERMDQIWNMPCFEEGRVLFSTIALSCRSLHELVVSFLAVLELVHADRIIAKMDEKENLWIQKTSWKNA